MSFGLVVSFNQMSRRKDQNQLVATFKTPRNLLMMLVVVVVTATGYLMYLASHATSSYDATILGDHPVAYWAMDNVSAGSEPDLSGHNHTGAYKGGTPPTVAMPDGEQAVDFNGSTEYLTVPSSAVFSIPTTGQLTWEGWIRPDRLQYASDYTDWMGKCQSYSPTCEWEARMYSTVNSQNRCNRLSAYVFNSGAGLGSGADWQPNCSLIQTAQWLYVVGEYQTQTLPSGCAGPQVGGINIWVNGVEWDQAQHLQTGCMSQYGITPTASTSPLNIGTMAFDSWFPGAIGKVAIYNYLLSAAQINAHFTAMTRAAPSGSCEATCTIPAPTQTGAPTSTPAPTRTPTPMPTPTPARSLSPSPTPAATSTPTPTSHPPTSGGSSGTTSAASIVLSQGTPVVSGNVVASGAGSGVIRVDGEIVSTNGKLDTSYLTNGKHTITVTQNGQSVTKTIVVHNKLSPLEWLRNMLFAEFHGNQTETNTGVILLGVVLFTAVAYLIAKFVKRRSVKTNIV